MMYFLLVGLFAVVFSQQVYRQSKEFCPYQQTMYKLILTSSVTSCALYCEIDKARCSRFVYDKIQEDCMLYQDEQSRELGANYTFGGRSLYLRSHKGCAFGYSFDPETNACIKVYDELRSWNNARQRCQEDGGDLVSMTTRAKWDFVSTLFNCSTNAFWIGLNKLNWVTGEPFDNVYGLDPEAIQLPTTDKGIQCRRVRFRLESPKTILGVSCAVMKQFVCELYIPN